MIITSPLTPHAQAKFNTAVGGRFKLLEPTSWVVENNLGDLAITADPSKPIDKGWPVDK